MKPAPEWVEPLLDHIVHLEGATAGVARAQAQEWLPGIPDACVDMVLTDPPYFIDKMGSEWDKEAIKRGQGRAGVVGSMPVGMKFDPRQGQELQQFLTPIFQQCYRMLKPGGFLVSFAQARLYHRMAMAAEDAGFEIRDMLGWIYEGQAKAFSQDHFVKRMPISEDEKQGLIQSLQGRKTPQLKPMIEPMVLAQKPREGTFVENWKRHQVGLIDTSQSWQGKFPGNIMPCKKPGAQERGVGNNHPTVKPQQLLQHLIRVFTLPGAVILDPFAGSSSTQLAALSAGRHGLGCEREEEDFMTSCRRLSRLALSSQEPDKNG